MADEAVFIHGSTVSGAMALFSRNFRCSRNQDHAIHFIFRMKRDGVEKIGQYPSFATLNETSISKYRKFLGDEYKELSTAVGLFSHGVGIGSFAYLRRIFENLIIEAKGSAAAKDGWNEEAYKRSRMDEKNTHSSRFFA